MEQEIWKDVPNYEGIYKCSNFGKVLSVGRFIYKNCSVCFRKDRNTMTSKYTGVSKNKNRWEANIKINGKPKYIGLFKTEVDAFNAYQNELKKII